MKGVVFLGDRKLELRDFPDPSPGPRDVILEIKASGMCGSDLHNYRAPAPTGAVAGGIKREAGMIAGHEPCGIVAAVGSAVTDREAQVGQRVMDHHYDGCGACKHCRAGWTQMCLAGAVVFGSGGHGGHARYMKVPVSTLVPLPDALSFVTGAAISCGTGTAWSALKRISVQGGETIAIFGQGPVGLSATQLAVEMGARVIAVDVAAERRKLAQAFGAHEVLDPKAGDVVKAIRDVTHGEGAHKTLDASSAPDARAAAVRAVRSWGTACFVGERGQVTLDVSPDLLRRQVTLVGHWTFSKQGQAECAEFIADRKVDVERLFTHRWRLEQADEAYKLFDTQTTGKAVTYVMGPPDPERLLRVFTSWEIPQKDNKWQKFNVFRFRNDEYDRLFRAAETEMDPVKRAAMFIRMNDIVIENGVVIPIAQRAKAAAIASRLRVAEPNPYDLDVWNIASWYREG